MVYNTSVKRTQKRESERGLYFGDKKRFRV